MRKLLIAVLSTLGMLSALFAFAACRDGELSYKLYLEHYIEINGSDEGALTEEEWTIVLGSGHIDRAQEIEKIELKCGNCVITFSDQTTTIVKDVSSSAGHTWDSGAITTAPTCMTVGVKTYTCTECGDIKQLILDADGESHVYAQYESDGIYHWQACRFCGEELKREHGFEDCEDGRICRECGYHDSNENYAYRITFETDAHVTVLVYETQDYTVDGIDTQIAYSRDSDTGALLKNGKGQVNFELVFEDGYGLADLVISPGVGVGYNALKGESDTGRVNLYRITKITNDLNVFISTCEIFPMYDFASFSDQEGNVNFSWQSDILLDYVDIEVLCGNLNEHYRVEGIIKNWNYRMTQDSVKYDFEFYFFSDGIEVSQTTCSRICAPSVRNVNFPRVEITTENHVWPTCEYVSAPEGYWGAGITNNNYVYSMVSIYDENNTKLFDSARGGDSDYSAARIKVRGNTSAYGEKKPYKIKLGSKADLLTGLVDGRDNGVSYDHKDWLLLASGNRFNNLIGWSISESLSMDYTPAYSYVALFVNGDYRGLYILCESVSQGKGSGDLQSRCKVDDDGFIVELDAYWWKEDLYFATPHTESTPMHYTFKYPDSDDIDETSNEYQYIKNYISEFETALSSGDLSYLNYIDSESFVRWLLAHDFLADVDSGGSNIYLTKKDSSSESSLQMSLIWDFDNIMGEHESFSKIRNEDFYYFPQLMRNADFVARYKELFSEVKSGIISNLESNFNKINAEAYNRLITIETDSFDQSYEAQKEAALNWFDLHIQWLEEQILNT